MASIKELKKNINYISSELFVECTFCRLYLPKTDPKKADEVMTKILIKQNEFLQRANHPDGKDNPTLTKKYFKQLIADLKAHIDDVIADMQDLNK